MPQTGACNGGAAAPWMEGKREGGLLAVLPRSSRRRSSVRRRDDKTRPFAHVLLAPALGQLHRLVHTGDGCRMLVVEQGHISQRWSGGLDESITGQQRAFTSTWHSAASSEIGPYTSSETV